MASSCWKLDKVALDLDSVRNRMNVRFYFVYFLCLLICSPGLTQERSSADNFSDEHVKRLQKEAKEKRQRYEAILNHFDGNIKAAKDSLRQYHRAVYEKDAQTRIAAYRSNDRPDTLTVIDLSHGRLDKLPDFVFQATQLELLILDHNDFKKLPGKIKKLKHLKRLEWSAIQVPHKKGKVPKLKSLETLDLSQNTFIKLVSLKKLKALRTLDLSKNQFSGIPLKAIQGHRALENLYMNQNTHLTIGPANYASIPSLKVLKLNECGLTAIDESLYGITTLTELQLPKNEIAHVPGGISNLKQLKTISFYKNQLEDLPADFYKLENLEIVDLYYNRLSRIDTAISLLQNLKVLYLSNNEIYDLPPQLGQLPNLRELYLAFNRLTAIPEIRGLELLRVLRIDHNNLYEFPNDLLYLTGLTYLDVSNNAIREIPPGLDTSYPNMELLYFRDNPIDFETPENQFIAPMIFEMSQRGVVCSPSFSPEKKKRHP